VWAEIFGELVEALSFAFGNKPAEAPGHVH
jgi:hypothetical protein